MRYQLLGRSGLRVSELALGTMTFGTEWGSGADKAASRRIFDRYADAGGNFIDTAVNYTDGASESFLGEFLAGRRDRFVVATKYTGTSVAERDPNQGGNGRKNMMQSVERSLRRLRTDYLDLFYLHVWDFVTPVEEVMRGLDDLVRAGKVRHLGISDTPAWIVAEANTRAELLGWSRFVAYQLPYSLVERTIERAELPLARHQEMALLAFGVLGEGLLSGKYGRAARGPRRLGERAPDARQAAIIEEVRRIADETGRGCAQVAINWTRQQRHKGQIIPLLGARTEAQLADNLACLEWRLDAAQLCALDQASRVDLGFVREVLEGDIRRHVFGATLELIDLPKGYPVR